jgi:hypothetical protein
LRDACWITGTALAPGAAIAATVVRPAAAQQKISHALAHYQDTPKGDDLHGLTSLADDWRPFNGFECVSSEVQAGIDRTMPILNRAFLF